MKKVALEQLEDDSAGFRVLLDGNEVGRVRRELRGRTVGISGARRWPAWCWRAWAGPMGAGTQIDADLQTRELAVAKLLWDAGRWRYVQGWVLTGLEVQLLRLVGEGFSTTTEILAKLCPSMPPGRWRRSTTHSDIRQAMRRLEQIEFVCRIGCHWASDLPGFVFAQLDPDRLPVQLEQDR